MDMRVPDDTKLSPSAINAYLLIEHSFLCKVYGYHIPSSATSTPSYNKIKMQNSTLADATQNTQPCTYFSAIALNASTTPGAARSNPFLSSGLIFPSTYLLTTFGSLLSGLPI